MAQLDKIIDGLYRISTFDERVGISFNQYLVKDEKSLLVHTGATPLFSGVVDRLREVSNPEELACIFISHFEADECGALGEFLKLNPDITVLSSAVTARQLTGFGFAAKVEAVKPGDIISIGERELHFISYPSEMHLWEGLLAYEVKDRVLFSSDLFTTRGKEDAPLKKASAREALKIGVTSIPSDEARSQCQQAIDRLDIGLVATGHGPVLDLRA